MRSTALAAVLAALSLAVPAHAQRTATPTVDRDAAVLDTRVRELEVQLTQLVADFSVLESRAAAPTAPAPSSTAQTVIGFVDQGGTLVLDWNGSRISIGSGGIEIEGNEIDLLASGSARVESGGTLLLKAGGAATLESNQSLTLKTSGAGKFESGSTLELKGALVKLNNGNQPVGGGSTVLVP